MNLRSLDGTTWPCPACRVVGRIVVLWEPTDYRTFEGVEIPVDWRIRFSCAACGTAGFRTREQMHGASHWEERAAGISQ